MLKMMFANQREFTLGGKYGDQICAIPSPNVLYGTVGLGGMHYYFNRLVEEAHDTYFCRVSS
jgi:hypothetical protein